MNPAWSPWTLGWTALALATFAFLFFRTAPYGRHAEGRWGPTIAHRVGWIVMEITSPLVLLAALMTSFEGSLSDLPTSHMILVGLWLGHYVYRAVAYPFIMRWKNKRMPVLIMGSAVAFNLVNGGLNGTHLAVRPTLSIDSPLFLAGGILFVGGLLINIHSDAILRSLRKPGETGYKIPEGGLYRFISCPNYFGEFIEWIGFAMMAATPAAITFAIWTAANLIPRALAHHRWYRDRFELYPAGRRAVVPFIL